MHQLLSCRHSRKTNDTSDIANSILSCLHIQVLRGFQYAGILYANTIEVILKRTLQVCTDNLFSAENHLWDSITMLENSNNRKAREYMEIARGDLFRCIDEFRKHAEIRTPPKLFGYLMLAKTSVCCCSLFFQSPD